MVKSKKTIVANDNSKGYIPDYYGSKGFGALGIFTSGRLPEFDTKKALALIKNDPVVKAALTTIVDRVLESGWKITGRNKRSRKKELEKKLKEVRFNRLLRKTLFNLFLYNNTFVEIVKKGEDLTDLNVLETTLVKIDAEDNGDVKGYYQEVGGDKNQPYWKTDLVTHVKFREITNNVWAEPLDLQALYETVLLKDYVRQWIIWFFGTNQMRPIFTIKNGANEAKIKDFISYIKASEKDRSKPIIVQGEVIVDWLNKFDNGDKIQDVLEWCDRQILMLLQVPPIAIGMPDSSGRSNSVEQYQSLNTTVLNVHRLLEDEFSYDLFPKIGFNDVDFEFGILDETARQRTFEIAEKMKNMMMTDEAITEFLESQGISFDTKKLFKDPEELMNLSNKDVSQGNEGAIGNKPQDSAPSRERQDAVGNSKLSKKNERTMVRNSEDKLNAYPYVYEVEEDAV